MWLARGEVTARVTVGEDCRWLVRSWVTIPAQVLTYLASLPNHIVKYGRLMSQKPVRTGSKL